MSLRCESCSGYVRSLEDGVILWANPSDLVKHVTKTVAVVHHNTANPDHEAGGGCHDRYEVKFAREGAGFSWARLSDPAAFGGGYGHWCDDFAQLIDSIQNSGAGQKYTWRAAIRILSSGLCEEQVLRTRKARSETHERLHKLVEFHQQRGREVS